MPTESRQPAEQDLPGYFFGVDSLGVPISKNMPFIAIHKGDESFWIGESRVANIRYNEACMYPTVVIDADYPESVLDKLMVEIASRNEWIDIQTLENMSKSFWTKMQEYKAAELRMSDGEYSQDFHSPPEDGIVIEDVSGNQVVIIGFQRNNRGEIEIEVFNLDSLGVGTFTYPKDRPALSMRGSGKACVLTIDDKEYLANFTIKGMPDVPPHVNLERLNSPEQVVARLKLEFPWFDEGDLSVKFPVGDILINGEIPSEFGELTLIDRSRMKKIYHPESLVLIRPETTSTEFERKYAEARNYAKLVEMAIDIDLIYDHIYRPEEAIDLRNEILSSMTAAGRAEKTAQMLVELEHTLVQLLSNRWERERELFGSEFQDPYQKYIARFASSDTDETLIISSAFYFNNLYVFNDVPSLSRKNGLFKMVQNRKDLRKLFFENIAEICAHEIGHTGIEGLRSSASGGDKSDFEWPREEIWVTWKAQLYPRELAEYKITKHMDAAMTAVYNRNIYFQEIGYRHIEQETIPTPFLRDGNSGAATLAAMIERIRREAVARPNTKIKINGQKYDLTPEFVDKCALATAFFRQETGSLSFKGQKLVGFKDLYNAYSDRMAKKGYYEPNYETELKGCGDEDYANFHEYLVTLEQDSNSLGIPDDSYQEESGNPKIIRIEQALYRKVAEAAEKQN